MLNCKGQNNGWPSWIFLDTFHICSIFFADFRWFPQWLAHPPRKRATRRQDPGRWGAWNTRAAATDQADSKFLNMIQHLYIIICSHIVSYIIIYYQYHILSFIIIYYHVLSYITVFYHILSYVIIFYHILSYVLIYCHILLYIIYYHILSYLIICDHLVSYIIRYIYI